MSDGLHQRPGVVVLVGTTDRPFALRELCEDLVRAAARVPCAVTLGIVENSTTSASRELNRSTCAALVERGIEVVVADCAPGGLGIGEARERQRGILEALVRRGQRPIMVWMLDDDLRMLNMVVDRGALTMEPVSDPLGQILELGRRPDVPDVAVGVVHGDPPIPAMATWASRVADLVANVERMMALGPDAPWLVDERTVERLREPDFYYDYGAHPEVDAVAQWLPRRAGQSVGEALDDMMAEAAYLPCGIGFSRPLIAARQPELAGSSGAIVALRGDARVRGGNTVFFDVDACLQHEYPVTEVGGVQTRRADSIGLHVLKARRGARVVTIEFALLHKRPRGRIGTPQAGHLARHLVGDTVGAALTRAVEGASELDVAAFLRARVDRVEVSLRRLRAAIRRLSSLASSAPRWVKARGLDSLAQDDDGLVAWLSANVPGLDSGRLPEPTRTLMLSTELPSRLGSAAARVLDAGGHGASGGVT